MTKTHKIIRDLDVSLSGVRDGELALYAGEHWLRNLVQERMLNRS